MLGVDWQIHANVRRICGIGKSTTHDGSGIRENQQILIMTTPHICSKEYITAIAVSSRQIDLNWHDNSDNEDGFEIERKEAEGSFMQIATVETDVTNYSDVGVYPNTTYTYRVRAYNTAGKSDWSSEATETTPNIIPTPPEPGWRYFRHLTYAHSQGSDLAGLNYYPYASTVQVAGP